MPFRYVVQVLSEWFWDGSSRHYYYRYQFCFHIIIIIITTIIIILLLLAYLHLPQYHYHHYHHYHRHHNGFVLPLLQIRVWWSEQYGQVMQATYYVTLLLKEYPFRALLELLLSAFVHLLCTCRAQGQFLNFPSHRSTITSFHMKDNGAGIDAIPIRRGWESDAMQLILRL